jgi:hypothetical protein
MQCSRPTRRKRKCEPSADFETVSDVLSKNTNEKGSRDLRCGFNACDTDTVKCTKPLDEPVHS